jgi:GPI ethanolamine phosphate transferase 1
LIVGSYLVPFLHRFRPSTHYIHRLITLFLAFSPSFIILTVSYEGLFYVAFCATLISWVRLEHKIYTYQNPEKSKDSQSPPKEESDGLKPALTSARERLSSITKGEFRTLTLGDARISLFFLFLLQSAFFSVGNLASISSFSLDAVYRLIPVFDPFSQGALLILKIFIPFIFVSSNLGILNRRLGVAPSALFMMVMAIGDIMTLNFFYMVRDEGSWLDIGATLSQFCIASGLCIFVALLEILSEVFVSGITFGEEKVSDANPGGGLNGRVIDPVNGAAR